MDETYDPVQGTGWSYGQGMQAWSSGTMRRTGPEWQLRGHPGAWVWHYWDFKNWRGTVTVEPDGFHWETTSYDTGEVIYSGVTASLYVAYQSVVQNRDDIKPPEGVRAS